MSRRGFSRGTTPSGGERERRLARIDALNDDGRGVARVDGKVTFIDGALPGELVKYRIMKGKRNFDQGELVEVVEASSHRVTPACEYFGVGRWLQPAAPGCGRSDRGKGTGVARQAAPVRRRRAGGLAAAADRSGLGLPPQRPARRAQCAEEGRHHRRFPRTAQLRPDPAAQLPYPRRARRAPAAAVH